MWSLANIAGMRLRRRSAPRRRRRSTPTRSADLQQTRDAAYQIIERKGATYYAVAAGLVRIVEAILRDQRTVLSVSSLIDDYYGIDDVYLSLPAVIGRDGVERIAAARAVRRGGVRPPPVRGAAARDHRPPRARRACLTRIAGRNWRSCPRMGS